NALAVCARGGSEADDRIIAMSARQFGKSDTGVLVGGGNAHGGQHFLRTQRSFKQALEEGVRFHRALALGAGNINLAAKRQDARRQLRRRIGESDGAAERAAVTDRLITYL